MKDGSGSGNPVHCRVKRHLATYEVFATATMCLIICVLLFRGSKSRNKVSVGEPAERSLGTCIGILQN